jgi:hypothetical protein
VAKDKDLPGYQVLQPEYNLYDRASYDGALHDLCIVRRVPDSDSILAPYL